MRRKGLCRRRRQLRAVTQLGPVNRRFLRISQVLAATGLAQSTLYELIAHSESFRGPFRSRRKGGKSLGPRTKLRRGSLRGSRRGTGRWWRLEPVGTAHKWAQSTGTATDNSTAPKQLWERKYRRER